RHAPDDPGLQLLAQMARLDGGARIGRRPDLVHFDGPARAVDRYFHDLGDLAVPAAAVIVADSERGAAFSAAACTSFGAPTAPVGHLAHELEQRFATLVGQELDAQVERVATELRRNLVHERFHRENREAIAHRVPVADRNAPCPVDVLVMLVRYAVGLGHADRDGAVRAGIPVPDDLARAERGSV